MSVLLSINTKKHTSISTEAIFENIKLLLAERKESGYNVESIDKGNEGYSFTSRQDNFDPHLKIEFLPSECRLIVYALNSRILTKIKGLFGPLPVSDMAQILLQSKIKNSHYTQFTFDCIVDLEICGPMNEFQRHLFSDSTLFQDQWNSHKEDFMRRVYQALEYVKIMDFQQWAEDINLRDLGTLWDYLPIIEENHPGFTEALKWNHELCGIQYKKNRAKQLEFNLGIFNNIFGDSVLGPVFNIGENFKREVQSLRPDFKFLNGDFKWPVDMTQDMSWKICDLVLDKNYSKDQEARDSM